MIQIQMPAPQGGAPRMDQALGVKTTKCMSIMLMVTGLLMIGPQTICTIIARSAEHEVSGHGHFLGAGIWCGIIIFISGVIGLLAALKKTKTLVVLSLIINVLCVPFALVMIVFTGFDLTDAEYYFCNEIDHEDHDHDHYVDEDVDVDDHEDFSHLLPVTCYQYSKLLGLTILLLLDAVLVFCLLIWGIVTNSLALEKAKVCCCQCCEDSTSQMQTQMPIAFYLSADQMTSPVAGQPLQLHAFPKPSAHPNPSAFSEPSAPPNPYAFLAANKDQLYEQLP